MVEAFAVTRSVRDAALLLDAVAGPGVGDKYAAPAPVGPYAGQVGRDPGVLRVAVTTGAWSGAPVDAEVAGAAWRAAAVLREQGHHVVEASPQVDWEAVIEALVVAQVAFLGSVFRGRRPDPALLEGVSRSLLEEAGRLSAFDLLAAMDAQNRVSRAVAGFFAGFDLLVTPTLAQVPAALGAIRYDEGGWSVAGFVREMFRYGPFTPLFNVTGQPAISLPLASGAGGLPIGVRLVARHGREDLLLRVAARLLPGGQARVCLGRGRSPDGLAVFRRKGVVFRNGGGLGAALASPAC